MLLNLFFDLNAVPSSDNIVVGIPLCEKNLMSAATVLFTVDSLVVSICTDLVDGHIKLIHSTLVPGLYYFILLYILQIVGSN
jgi:hypothetical protein